MFCGRLRKQTAPMGLYPLHRLHSRQKQLSLPSLPVTLSIADSGSLKMHHWDMNDQRTRPTDNIKSPIVIFLFPWKIARASFYPVLNKYHNDIIMHTCRCPIANASSTTRPILSHSFLTLDHGLTNDFSVTGTISEPSKTQTLNKLSSQCTHTSCLRPQSVPSLPPPIADIDVVGSFCWSTGRWGTEFEIGRCLCPWLI